MVTLFEHLSRENADTFSLVLNAEGIGHRVIPTANRFRIDVPETLAEAALTAVYRYRSENLSRPSHSVSGHRPSTPLSLSGILIALVLLAVYLAVEGSQAPQDYDSVFGADARLILRGQLYRCATALVLHADATHIVSNMAGIALFGGAVCAITGVGVGWLLMLACGIFGNLINAWAYEWDHLSVGASTAIFGALGILCAVQAVDAMRTGKGWKRVALITGAGVALLAFLGAGVRSDIGAHLFGWLAGLVLGGMHGLFFKRPVTEKWQRTCGVLAALIILGAWVRGTI